MKRFLGIICAMLILLSLQAAHADAQRLDLQTYELSNRPFASQEGITDEALDEIEAWAAQFSDTDYEALFLREHGDYHLTEKSLQSAVPPITADDLTGPFFIVMEGGGSAHPYYPLEENRIEADKIAEAMLDGRAQLRRVDIAPYIDARLQPLFDAQRYVKLAETDAPSLFCVLEYSGYHELGQYKLENSGMPVTVYAQHARFYVIDAQTGALRATARIRAVDTLHPPSSLTAKQDHNGKYLYNGDSPWKGFFDLLPIGGSTISGGVFERGDETLATQEIPEGVTEIAAQAFEGMAVETVIIPEGVTHIGNRAFYRCGSLKEVRLPETLVSIGASAFAESGLEQIQLPDGLETLGASAFADTRLTNIVIPAGVTKIESNTFMSCRALTSVELPEGLLEIGDGAFQYTYELTDISFPQSMERIGLEAFSNAAMKSLVLPEGLLEMDAGAFYACRSLESAVLPASLKHLPESAFENCEALREVTLPEGLESIDKRAFYGAALAEIQFPESLRTIGDEAFRSMKNLKDVTLPGTLTELGNNIFDGCTVLETIRIEEGITELGYYTLGRPNHGLKHLYLPMSVEKYDDRESNLDFWRSLALQKPTVHAPKGSLAETMAREYKIRFEATK